MKRLTVLAVSAVIATMGFTGCGGGSGGGGIVDPPTAGRGAMGEASPMIGFVQFTGAGTCNNNGWYLTVNFDEDEQGNLTGTAKGRYVSPQNPPPSGDDKYTGPLNANITGKRTGDQINFTLTGDMKGTYSGTVQKAESFSKLSFQFTGQPGCTDSNGTTHGGKVFLVGDPITQ